MRRYGESEDHEKQKERIANVLRFCGWVAFTEYRFSCNTEKRERTYWADVYAQNFCIVYSDSKKSQSFSQGVSTTLVQSDEINAGIQIGGRRIIVEIQGPGGHHSKAAYDSEQLRLEDIRREFGSEIEYFELYIPDDVQRRQHVSRTKSRSPSPLDVRTWSTQDIEEELKL